MGYVAKLKEDFDDRGFSGASLAKNQAVWVSKEGSGGHGVVMVAPYVGPFHEQEIGVPESLLVKVAMNDLNDFGVIKPELLKGPVEVWYMTEAGWREVSSGITVHPEKISLGITHELLGEIKERNLQKAWVALQGDFWSPHGEARGLIQSEESGVCDGGPRGCLLHPQAGIGFVHNAVQNRHSSSAFASCPSLGVW